MTRRVYFYFILTFILGVVVGGVGVYMYGWYSGHWHRHLSRQQVVEYLQRKLDLSNEQTAQLKQIVDEMRTKQEVVREATAPQFRAIREEARSRIRAILNSQQVQEFNEMVKRWDERRKQRRQRFH